MTQTLADLNAGQKEFVNQMTRRCLVTWCDRELSGLSALPSDTNPLYIEHARLKGWLAKGETPRVLSAGWKTAASFLKR